MHTDMAAEGFEASVANVVCNHWWCVMGEGGDTLRFRGGCQASALSKFVPLHLRTEATTSALAPPMEYHVAS